MKNSTKYIIISLSILSAAGVGYFIYSKVQIASLNKKVSTLQYAEYAIESIDTSDVFIPEDVSTEPELPMYNNSGSDDEDSLVYNYDNYNYDNYSSFMFHPLF